MVPKMTLLFKIVLIYFKVKQRYRSAQLLTPTKIQIQDTEQVNIYHLSHAWEPACYSC